MELPLIYANNESKPMLACDFEEYRDGERNSQSVFHSFVIKMIRDYSSASRALSAMTRS